MRVIRLIESGFRQYLQERRLSAEEIDSAVEAVKGFEERARWKGSRHACISLVSLKLKSTRTWRQTVSTWFFWRLDDLTLSRYLPKEYTPQAGKL